MTLSADGDGATLRLSSLASIRSLRRSGNDLFQPLAALFAQSGLSLRVKVGFLPSVAVLPHPGPLVRRLFPGAATA